MSGIGCSEAFASLPKGRFKAALQAIETIVSDALRQRFTLPEGVGDVQGREADVSYAVIADKSFAAVRIAGPGGARDLLCVDLSEVSLLLVDRTRHQIGRFPAWWEELAPEPCQPPARVPGFLELAVLAAGPPACAVDSQHAERLQDCLQERQYLAEVNAEQAEELHRLTVLVDQLRRKPVGTGGPDTWSPGVRLWQHESTLAGLEEWASLHPQKVVLLPRALAGAKKSIYREPWHVYKALDFLAGPYYEYRTGTLSKPQMEAALMASGCQLAGATTASVAGTQGDTYFVRWGDQRRRMDQHLRRGGGRDERFCLRIYFFWDNDTRQIVVGWLPSHLDNSLT